MTSDEKAIKPKLALLKLAEELGNVSRACRIMGYSRDSFYRFKELYERGGEEALKDLSKRKPLLKNRVAPDIENAVIDIAIEDPAHGQKQAHAILAERGVKISESGIRSIWLRNGLETFPKRVKALETRIAQDGLIPSDEQKASIARACRRRECNGDFITRCPGHVTSQDTFLVGVVTGINHVYQQTFIDVYSRVVFAKVYTEKSPETATDLLAERVIPFYNDHDVKIRRILTDRSAEYCGRGKEHSYQSFLKEERISHSKAKVRHDDLYDGLHRTMRDEFYARAFRANQYETIEQLQADLDAWLEEYNSSRPFQGEYCYGKTPMQTFLDARKLAE